MNFPLSWPFVWRSTAIYNALKHATDNRNRFKAIKSVFTHRPVYYWLNTDLGKFQCVDIASAVQFSQKWELQIKAQINEVADSLFVDVGANIGYYSVMAARNRNMVIAIEPNPQVRMCLEHNLESYSMSRILPFAAWSRREVLHLHSTGYTDRTEISKFGSEVMGIPLDEVLREYQPPALVKIDVEGVESEVLRGMRKTLQQGTRLIIEIWNASNYNRVFGILSPLGYSLFALDAANFLAVRLRKT